MQRGQAIRLKCAYNGNITLPKGTQVTFLEFYKAPTGMLIKANHQEKGLFYINAEFVEPVDDEEVAVEEDDEDDRSYYLSDLAYDAQREREFRSR